jgi:hypothetical protein
MVCGSVEIKLQILLASELDANCVQLLAFADLRAGKIPILIGGWEGPRTAMETSETKYKSISYPC